MPASFEPLAAGRCDMRNLSKQVKRKLFISFLLGFLISACGKVADTRIVFESDRDGSSEIYIMNADGSQVSRLTTNGGSDPTWSPDKKQIAYACPGGFCIMKPDGSQQSPLPNIPAGSWEPTWSGDGKWIAFTSDYEIYKIKVDGSGLTNLTNNQAADYHPSFSPDSKRIAFVSERENNTVEIYVMNADGTNPERITHTGFATMPSWSADSDRITYFCNGMCVMNADGSSQIVLLNDPKYTDQAAWSPDGTRMAFSSSRDGNLEIYIMNSDGTQVTRLTDDPAHDRNPDW
jgi:Tol biopolymer transport system component